MEDKKKPAAKAAKPAKKKVASKTTKAPAKAAKTADKPVEATPASTPVSTPNTSPVLSSTPGEQPKSSHKRNWLVIGGTILGLLVIIIGFFSILIYKYHSDNRVVQLVSEVIPFPAEKVNGHYVSYADYLFEVNSIKHYYQSQTTADGKPAVDFNTADGKQKLKQLQEQVIVQLQQDAIVNQLAKENKVTVSNKEIQDQVDQITKSAGGTDKVKDVLKKFYGWDINDLKKKIKQQILKQKVSEKISSNSTLNTQAEAKAKDVQKQVQAGGDFAALAKQYSQDTSASNGGDLGCFGKGQMVKPFEDAAFALQPGQVSGIVKTQYGYHIIKVTDKKDDQVCASHILIKTVDFDQYLADQQKKDKVTIYIK